MSFADLFYLKFIKGLSTVELARQFPQDKRKICLLALCSLPDRALRSLVKGETFKRVQRLREATRGRFRIQAE